MARIDITPHATTPNTPIEMAISKSKKIHATNGVNIIQIIINTLTQIIAAIMAITANIANRIIPRMVRIDDMMKNIPNTIAVIIRHIETMIPKMKQVMTSNAAMEIINKVNPAHPRVSIANARANIMNPNKSRSIAVTIPVSPTQVIESERHRTVKARNVIVRAKHIIHNAKNGMAVHITHNRAVRKNATEQRKHALADKHKVRSASTRAIRARQIIINPKIIQIKDNAGVIMHKAVPAKHKTSKITIMLIMKMIRGTTTKPNQLTKTAEAKVNTPNITAIIPHIISKMNHIGARINITTIRERITNATHPITGHKVSIDKGRKHTKNKEPVIISIIGKAIVMAISHRQLNNKKGIENGNNGIDTIAVNMNTHTPNPPIIIAMKTYHSAKAIITI